MDDARQRLLERKFGDLLDWQKPKVVQTIGPYDSSAFDDFEALLVQAIKFVRERLEGYSDAEIAVLSDPLAKESRELRLGWQAILVEAFGKKSQEPPSWCAGGLGHPDYRADFEYWSKMSDFSIEEIVCLSVGVAPDKYGAKLAELAKKLDRSKLWPALQFILKRYDLIVRRFSTRLYSRDFIIWAEKIELELPAEFRGRLLTYHHPSAPNAAATNTASKPDKREIDKISQLLTAIVVDSYGYDPEGARSPIPKEITDIAASMGLEISAETVRKYLRQGASFLPKDWKPK